MPAGSGQRTPTVASASMACQRRKTEKKSRGNEPYTSEMMPLHENLGGEAGKVVLTGGVDGVREDDDVDGESPLLWKKVLQNHFLAAHENLGH
jgi:hypothetical protein